MSAPIRYFSVLQGPVFLINSRLANFRCLPPKAGNPSPEVTGSFFAEFLKLLSLDRLGLLDQPTCVGLRYGNICVLLNLAVNIMKLFLDAEKDQIIPCCQGTFYHSSIKHDDGFANHHYLTV